MSPRALKLKNGTDIYGLTTIPGSLKIWPNPTYERIIRRHLGAFGHHLDCLARSIIRSSEWHDDSKTVCS